MKNNRLTPGVPVRTRVQVGEVLLYDYAHDQSGYVPEGNYQAKYLLDQRGISYTEIDCLQVFDSHYAPSNSNNDNDLDICKELAPFYRAWGNSRPVIALAGYPDSTSPVAIGWDDFQKRVG